MLRPWICRTCRLHQRLHRRSITTSAFRPASASAAAAHASSSKSSNDDVLRRVFDSQPFWREFSQSSSFSPGQKPTGFVQNQYLTSPDGFRAFAQVSLQKCQAIVSRVLAASTVDEYRDLVRQLDRLSDLLCRVIDLSDFTKAFHPDPPVQQAAAQAFGLIFQYMNVLNTTTGLHAQLRTALDRPEVTAQWSSEETMVARILLQDFVNSAIHMPQSERQRFITLSNEISDVGSDFAYGAEPARSHVVVPTNELRGLDPIMIQQIRRWNPRSAAIPTTGVMPRLALRSAHNENIRREIYQATRTASGRQIQRLEQLLARRTELAQLTGFPTYAHMTLNDKMAKSPVAVSEFLTTLVKSNRPGVQEELAQLQAQKGSQLQPWDHAYYAHQRVQKYETSELSRKSRELASIPEYFSLGTVMQGLSRLFDRLYGVRLVPRETPAGETWTPDVRRLDVLDESDRPVAVIYCDLFSRPGKHPNPAHFTLRCAREITPEEIAESAAMNNPAFVAHPNDGMATAVDPDSRTLRQLPTIALVCDFAEPSRSTPSLLDENSVRTLFHEMGHAIHSILGQTKLQSISGTRCATDFAELPSVLMERFAMDPSVLALYARHWQTDQPLSEAMMHHMARDRAAHGAIYGAVENEAQILMALVDQAYHTTTTENSFLDTTNLYQQVYSTHASLPDPVDQHGRPSTSWQGFFGHLYGYGATYYSYIFDRAIANKLWEDVFQGGGAAVDRTAGERYKNEVLRWGGGRNGWECVAGVLGSQNPSNANGRLVEGADEAMREVGRWGLGRD